MDQWSHYLSTSIVETTVAVNFESEKENLSTVVLDKWSQRPLRASSRLPTAIPATKMGGCLDESHDMTVESSSTIPVPRRNLAEAFDELYVEPPAELQVTTPATKTELKHLDDVSPVAVADLNVESQTPPDDDNDVAPHFYLHSDLKRELDQELVNRVSMYGVIFDVNKEATSMASNDFLTIQRVKSMDEEDEVYSPLVVAVKGGISKPSLSHTDTALIDEEHWLLTAIEARKQVSTETSCPPTFLQAMGEREYENPLSLEKSRTQLWKPSRSWWEAKSGKNPWIEPKSHNKRWRYLWPLIHYHKFLAKCIKKLKRNGVDVKVTVSPVAVFLREEVCAVSDHLSSVSLFSSEQWMACLQNFHGWTDPKSEERLRGLVSSMKLRPMDEPGDVESPLLRDQIDAQFLRAMVASRESMTGVSKKITKTEKSEDTEDTTMSSRHGLPLHPHSRSAAPPRPRTISTPRSKPGLRSAESPSAKASNGSSSSRPSSYMYPNGHWYGNGWAPPFALCDENTSVHSALSGDSYPCGYPAQHYDPNFHGMYHQQMPYYPPPQTPEQSMCEQFPPVPPFYPNYDPYNPEHALAASQGWYGPDPNMMYGPPQTDAAPPSTPGPASPESEAAEEEEEHDASRQTGLSPYGNAPAAQTPYKDYPQAQVPMSPFWSHMDYQMHTTLAMTGIVTPHKAPPSTPRGLQVPEEERSEGDQQETEQGEEIDAKPLYANHHYYPYGYGGTAEGFVPPSPATQFMMSPQANSQAAAYYAAAAGYNPYYHQSPARRSARRRGKRTTPPRSAKTEDSTKMTPPPSVIRKTVDAEASDSDHTAATAAESESVSGN